jgi:hypothetical protein
MLASRPILFWSLVGIAVLMCLSFAWLAAGLRISMFVDRFATIRKESLAVSPLVYDVTNLRVGNASLDLIGTDNQRFNLEVQADPQNRLVLSKGGQSFTLGPRSAASDPSGAKGIVFTSEPGDEISLHSERSLIGQPTPFEWSLLGGSSPTLKRYVYFRLSWKKHSGAKLDMLWRFEELHYKATGWTEPRIMYDFRTGLLRVDISPEPIAQESVAVQYISKTKGWKRSQYRIENRGLSTDGRSAVLEIIFLNDLYWPKPGAGESVVLHVDRATHQVTKELGGQ